MTLKNISRLRLKSTLCIMAVTTITGVYAGPPMEGTWKTVHVKHVKRTCALYVDDHGNKYNGTDGLFEAVGKNVVLTCEKPDSVEHAAVLEPAAPGYEEYVFRKSGTLEKTVIVNGSRFLLSGVCRDTLDTLQVKFMHVTDECGTRYPIRDSMSVIKLNCRKTKSMFPFFRYERLWNVALSRDTLYITKGKVASRDFSVVKLMSVTKSTKKADTGADQLDK